MENRAKVINAYASLTATELHTIIIYDFIITDEVHGTSCHFCGVGRSGKFAHLSFRRLSSRRTDARLRNESGKN